MAIRILQADVRLFVKETLLNVRLGLEDALAQGLTVELPEKMDFQLEIVSNDQSMLTVTAESTVEPAKLETTSEGSSIDSTVGSGGTDTTTRAAVTDTATEAPSVDIEEDSRAATQGTTESGGDSQTGSKSYSSYTT
jgi:hypothetical protein